MNILIFIVLAILLIFVIIVSLFWEKLKEEVELFNKWNSAISKEPLNLRLVQINGKTKNEFLFRDFEGLETRDKKGNFRKYFLVDKNIDPHSILIVGKDSLPEIIKECSLLVSGAKKREHSIEKYSIKSILKPEGK